MIVGHRTYFQVAIEWVGPSSAALKDLCCRLHYVEAHPAHLMAQLHAMHLADNHPSPLWRITVCEVVALSDADTLTIIPAGADRVLAHNVIWVPYPERPVHHYALVESCGNWSIRHDEVADLC